MTSRPRVVLADDDASFRAAAVASLLRDGDVDLVGVAVDGAEALRAVVARRATVLLMDLGMAGGGAALAVAAQVAVPGLHVAVLTARDGRATCDELLRTGVRCIVSKYGAEVDLTRVAVRCHHGDVVLVGHGPTAALDALVAATASDPPGATSPAPTPPRCPPPRPSPPPPGVQVPTSACAPEQNRAAGPSRRGPPLVV